MNITDKVKIGGQFYTIKLVDKCNTDNRNTDGQIIYSEDTIEICKDLKGDYLDSVLCHEIMHGLYEHCGFKQNENQVERLSKALHMVIKDNPEIFK